MAYVGISRHNHWSSFLCSAPLGIPWGTSFAARQISATTRQAHHHLSMDHDDSATATGTAVAKAVDEKHEVQSEKESRLPTASLSDQEKEIIDRQLTAPNLTVGYFSLFRYATAKDKVIMVVALIASIAAGAVMPLMTVSDIKSLTPLISYWNYQVQQKGEGEGGLSRRTGLPWP